MTPHVSSWELTCHDLQADKAVTQTLHRRPAWLMDTTGSIEYKQVPPARPVESGLTYIGPVHALKLLRCVQGRQQYSQYRL